MARQTSNFFGTFREITRPAVGENKKNTATRGAIYLPRTQNSKPEVDHTLSKLDRQTVSKIHSNACMQLRRPGNQVSSNWQIMSRMNAFDDIGRIFACPRDVPGELSQYSRVCPGVKYGILDRVSRTLPGSI